MFEVDPALLREHSFCIASPQYGGQASSLFCQSLPRLFMEVGKHDLKFDFIVLGNESLIPRARNYCVEIFLNKTKADHLIFIDADIGFNGMDVLELLTLQAQDERYDIIGAPYKIKSIAQDRYALRFSPEEAIKANMVAESGVHEPVEITGIGTGFMMIRRSVFERFKAKFPQYDYKIDEDRRHQCGGRETMTQFFQSEIDPVTKTYLSEDYWFSERCKEIGVRTWFCPWMHLRHFGNFIYE